MLHIAKVIDPLCVNCASRITLGQSSKVEESFCCCPFRNQSLLSLTVTSYLFLFLKLRLSFSSLDLLGEVTLKLGCLYFMQLSP